MAIVAVGSELAGYRIDELIARGGMGVVYRATDLRLGRPVAIKLIAADLSGDAAMRQRFEREARMMAALDHPNVLPVYAAGEDEGSLYLVMRYVDGTDVAGLLRTEGRLSPPRAVRITEQVASALDSAHRAGVVHRDIKPANVLLAGEHVYLSDFGIGRAVEAATRITDTNDWLGTVDFCAPEQLRGEPVDARSDVYSLGCLLHAALTGIPPHHRDTTAATMFAHLNESPPRPSLTPGVGATLDAVVARALAKRPSERYPSAGALAHAARCALESASSAPADDHAAGRAPSPVTRRREHRNRTVTSHTRRQAPRRRIRTRLDLRPRPAIDANPARTPSTRAIAAAFAGLLVTIAVAIGVAALLLSGRPTVARPGALTRAEVSSVLRSFTSAYGRRDNRALTALLAPSVTRIDATSAQNGRATVSARYAAELADPSIVSYRLTGVNITTGWVARATARYEVVRTGRTDLSGTVTFGIERVAARPEIDLITTR